MRVDCEPCEECLNACCNNIVVNLLCANPVCGKEELYDIALNGRSWSSGMLCPWASCDAEGCVDVCCCCITLCNPACGIFVPMIADEGFEDVCDCAEPGRIGSVLLYCCLLCVLPPLLQLSMMVKDGGGTFFEALATRSEHDGRCCGRLLDACCLPLYPALSVAQIMRENRVQDKFSYPSCLVMLAKPVEILCCKAMPRLKQKTETTMTLNSTKFEQAKETWMETAEDVRQQMVGEEICVMLQPSGTKLVVSI